MAYNLDVPFTLAAAGIFVVGVIVAVFLLARGSPPKRPRKDESKSKKPAKKSSASAKEAKKPKTDKKKPASKPEKKTAAPKAEVRKSDPAKAVDQAATSSSVTPAASTVAESPKTEARSKAESKNEKKKQARKSATKPVVVEEPEELSLEDVEFARVMTGNAKKSAAVGTSKKAEADTAEAETTDLTASGRNWAEINAKNSEVQKFKGKLKEADKEISELRKIIDENKRKMREYNLTNAKLVSEKTTLKDGYEDKISRLKADIEAMRDNRADVSVKSGDALRDRNYVVNVLQQERDSLKNQYSDLQSAYDDLRKEFQKASGGDNENLTKGLQQQLEALSQEHGKLVSALQESKQNEAALHEQLQSERRNAAHLQSLLDTSAAGKEVANEDGHEDTEPISS
jgi:CII-binding regulator of phage lambda lysogenization HflD